MGIGIFIGNRIGSSRGGGVPAAPTILSAIVENAAPTHVVITLDKENTTWVAGDFTVTDHTVSSLSRNGTNTILTLVLSTAVIFFEKDLDVEIIVGSITYLYSITNNVADDGKSLVWYDDLSESDLKLDTSYKDWIMWDKMVGSAQRGTEQNSGVIVLFGVYEITACQTDFFYTGNVVGDIFICGVVKTCDANNKVKKVLGRHVGQPTPANRPEFGIFISDTYPDGLWLHGEKETEIAQPITSYFLVKRLGWTLYAIFFDMGAGITFERLADGWTSSPQLYAHGGLAAIGPDENFAIGQKSIIKTVFNGAGSSIKVGSASVTTGNAGTSGFKGVTIGCVPNALGEATPDMRFYRKIVRNNIDSADYIASLENAINRYSAFKMKDYSDIAMSAMRATIKSRIWPSGYPATGKDSITIGVASPLLTDSANLASVDQLSFTIIGITANTPYVWHPTISNGKFVIWHLDHFYSYSGTDIWESMGRADCIRALINEGYTVCGIYMPPANDGTEGAVHSYPIVAAPYQIVTDLHYFLDTTIRILNEYTGQFTEFYMVGHSGGAWTSVVMAALDERITKSACSAGSMSNTNSRLAEQLRDWEQHLPGINDLVDYGDLYVMSCTKGRTQTQYLNANEDPALTGFHETNYNLLPYGVRVKKITSNWDLQWDTVTTTHSISTATKEKIIAFFNS